MRILRGRRPCSRKKEFQGVADGVEGMKQKEPGFELSPRGFPTEELSVSIDIFGLKPNFQVPPWGRRKSVFT
jgi:hypothetical protein